jgi:hypothetical protein
MRVDKECLYPQATELRIRRTGEDAGEGYTPASHIHRTTSSGHLLGPPPRAAYVEEVTEG